MGIFTPGTERAVGVRMVQVFVKVAAPPDRTQQFVEALRSLEVRARQDRGCETATVIVSVDRPGHFVLHEDWTEEANLRRHIRSADFTGVLEVMEMSADRPVLEFRFVNHTRGLDYVAEVRDGPDSPPGHVHDALSDGEEPDHRRLIRGRSK
jgi:quinol monooxygenase YgiN